MRLAIGLVVIVGWTIVTVVWRMVGRLIGRLVVRGIVIQRPAVRLVDPTVMIYIGHSGVGFVDFLEAAGVFISGQDTVLSST